MSKKKTASKKKSKKKASVKNSPVKSKKKTTKKKSAAGRILLLEKNHLSIQKKLVKALKDGYWREAACVKAGINKSSFYGWLKKGEEIAQNIGERLEEGGTQQEIEKTLTDNDLIFLEFIDAIQQAELEIAGKAITAVKKGFDSKDGWRAAISFLERRFPKQFGKTDKVELTGNEGEPIAVQIYLPSNGR